MKKVAVVVFVTRDGKVVLQRKTHDYPKNPNKLALFGGQIEEGETADEAVRREVLEETSLKEQEFKKIAEQHWYVSEVDTIDFETYEGAGAEVFYIDDALSRDDLTYSTRYILEKIKNDNNL